MGVDSVGSVGGDDVAGVAVVVCVCGAFDRMSRPRCASLFSGVGRGAS